jgi:hypothetical protein
MVARTAQERSTVGGVGFAGLIMILVPFVWWIWGMVDAKKLCESFNRGEFR